MNIYEFYKTQFILEKFNLQSRVHFYHPCSSNNSVEKVLFGGGVHKQRFGGQGVERSTVLILLNFAIFLLQMDLISLQIVKLSYL